MSLDIDTSGFTPPAVPTDAPPECGGCNLCEGACGGATDSVLVKIHDLDSDTHLFVSSLTRDTSCHWGSGDAVPRVSLACSAGVYLLTIVNSEGNSATFSIFPNEDGSFSLTASDWTQITGSDHILFEAISCGSCASGFDLTCPLPGMGLVIHWQVDSVDYTCVLNEDIEIAGWTTDGSCVGAHASLICFGSIFTLTITVGDITVVYQSLGTSDYDPAHPPLDPDLPHISVSLNVDDYIQISGPTDGTALVSIACHGCQSWASPDDSILLSITNDSSWPDFSDEDGGGSTVMTLDGSTYSSSSPGFCGNPDGVDTIFCDGDGQWKGRINSCSRSCSGCTYNIQLQTPNSDNSPYGVWVVAGDNACTCASGDAPTFSVSIYSMP